MSLANAVTTEPRKNRYKKKKKPPAHNLYIDLNQTEFFPKTIEKFKQLK